MTDQELARMSWLELVLSDDNAEHFALFFNDQQRKVLQAELERLKAL